jgi:hypothetical protein
MLHTSNKFTCPYLSEIQCPYNSCENAIKLVDGITTVGFPILLITGRVYYLSVT